MRNPTLILAFIATAVVGFSGQTGVVTAGEKARLRLPFRLSGLFSKSGVDVKSYKCDECGRIHGPDVECIDRVPVQECVTGKKKVYDSKIRYEYVSIPEVRYRWKNKWVTKEIPCEYCKPVCKTKECEACYGAERWDKEKTCCSTRHCKSIEHKTEKQTCKYCGSEPGQTTVKVRYKTCVKEPYTVYRRVKRPVCVKQPRYEKVVVPITRHRCNSVKCQGCRFCNGDG